MSQNNDQEYWQKRFEAMHESNLQKGDEFYKRVEDLYREAIDEIEKDLAKWYSRLKANNEVNLREAKRMLKNDELEEFKWTLEQYIKAAKENGISADWSKQLENASAKFHITRLQALEMQIRQHLEYLYGNYLEGMYEAMQETYQESFYNTAYELQIGTKAGFEVNQIDTKTLEKVLANPWAADDINFSERIHKDKTKLINNLQTELVQSIIRGTPQDKIVKSFANRMNISLHNAGRLIATESAYFATLGEKDSMTNLGVQQYEILATLDRRTSDICRHMDGKIFDMKDFKVGITAPPLHVWCRSCTIPHIGEKLLGSKRAARDGDDGKTYHVDGNMTYKDWKKVFVDKSISYKSWQDKQKNDRIRLEITQKIKEIKLPFECLSYPAKKIDLTNYTFDDSHANKERHHNITFKEAGSFVENAIISLTRFQGTYENYFSLEGATYVNVKENCIRTAYKKDEFKGKTKALMEVLKQYAK